MLEDKSYINLSGLGLALKKTVSEAHKGSRPTFLGAYELAKVIEAHNCKGLTHEKQVKTLRT